MHGGEQNLEATVYNSTVQKEVGGKRQILEQIFYALEANCHAKGSANICSDVIYLR